MKVILDLLIEAAITFTDFKSKYNRSAFNEKTKFFWSIFFTVFFRLPINESIAAIFWQSAGYVKSLCKIWHVRLGGDRGANNMHSLSWGGTNGKDPNILWVSSLIV